MDIRISVCGAAAVLVVIAGCATSNSPREISLFNGRKLGGWRQPCGDWQVVSAVKLNPANPKYFDVEPGHGVLMNSATNHTVNLVSEQEFGDCEVRVEFCVPNNSNSGVYLMGRYEVQIFDSWGIAEPKYSDCGGIYNSCSEPRPDSKGSAPAVNASKPPGEWQSFEITFRAPRFDAAGNKVENARFIRVVHNGSIIHTNVESERPTCAAQWLDERLSGPIMLQGDHGPVAYRRLVVRPLELE